VIENTYSGKKVLVTGHTGFKGSWLSAWLLEMGAHVIGVSDSVPTEPSHFKLAKLHEKVEHFEVDIRNIEQLQRVIELKNPEFVFHLAAQSLVNVSFEQPISTLYTNMLGSANLLESLRFQKKPCTLVVITSDKCYDNVEKVWGYRENDRLGGKDLYSASKGCAELVISAYVNSFFAESESKVRIAVGRAGNVIGGGDWAKGRILPDCVRAWSQNMDVDIRSLNATRPWQHVLEPLSGYLSLGSQLSKDPSLHGEPFNFGPSSQQNFTVQELIEIFSKYWGSVKWRDVSSKTKHPKEAKLLKLNCDKALQILKWRPTLSFEETVRMTAEWYKQYYLNPKSDINDFTNRQIKDYVKLSKQRGNAWAQE